MPTKPTDDVTWATAAAGAPNIDDPGAGPKASGWLVGNIPPRNWWNWMSRGIGRWVEYLRLGPIRWALGDMATDQGMLNDRVLMEETNTSASGINSRVYHDDAAGPIFKRWQTVNAYWVDTAGPTFGWNPDDPAQPSLAVVYDYATTKIAFLQRGAGAGPWLDAAWSEWFKFEGDAVLGSAVRMQLPIIDNTDAPLAAGIQEIERTTLKLHPCPAAASRSLAWQAEWSSENNYMRLYSDTAYHWLGVNASWTEPGPAGWARDVAGDSLVLRFNKTTGFFQVLHHDSAAASPWADAAWTALTEINEATTNLATQVVNLGTGGAGTATAQHDLAATNNLTFGVECYRTSPKTLKRIIPPSASASNYAAGAGSWVLIAPAAGGPPGIPTAQPYWFGSLAANDFMQFPIVLPVGAILTNVTVYGEGDGLGNAVEMKVFRHASLADDPSAPALAPLQLGATASISANGWAAYSSGAIAANNTILDSATYYVELRATGAISTQIGACVLTYTQTNPLT